MGGVEIWAALNIFGAPLSTVEEYAPEGLASAISSQGKLPTKWGGVK